MAVTVAHSEDGHGHAVREPALDLSALQAVELEMTALDRSGSVIVAALEFAP